ncbi:hypothetical protein JCM17960_28820 [Magnetospira thiophila]
MIEARLKDVLQQGQNLHEEILHSIGLETLNQCAKQLQQARRIYVAGVRSCYPVAYYFHYACRMFLDNVTLLDGQGGTFADELRRIAPEDVLLTISFQPYSRQVVRAVDYAVEHGAGIIALTDSPLSPLLRSDKLTPLILPAVPPSFFHGVVPAMAVVQALVMLLITHGGASALSGLSDSESQLDAFEAYWLEGEPRSKGLVS